MNKTILTNFVVIQDHSPIEMNITRFINRYRLLNMYIEYELDVDLEFSMVIVSFTKYSV